MIGITTATELSGFDTETRTVEVILIGPGVTTITSEFLTVGVDVGGGVVMIRAGRTATEIEFEAVQHAANDIQSRAMQAAFGGANGFVEQDGHAADFDLEAALAEFANEGGDAEQAD